MKSRCDGCGEVVSMKPEEHERFAEVVSRGFSSGNYCNAYETNDYEQAVTALDVSDVPGPLTESYRAAFTLGFFGSYELTEMGSDVEAYQEAYFSPVGEHCVKAGYVDEFDADDWKVVDEC